MYGKRPKNIPIIGKILKMKNIAHNSSMSIKKRVQLMAAKTIDMNEQLECDRI